MDCQDCAQAQARQEDGRGQSGLPLREQCRRQREERQNGQVVQVSAAASAAPLSRSERLASTVVANGAPAPGMLPKRPDRRARPQGQGRQVERGDRCDEQHIGDDQRAFLAGAQASQRAGGKIAHGESDAECGVLSPTWATSGHSAGAGLLPTAERRRHPSRSTVPWRAGAHDVRLAQPSRRALRGRNRRRRWGATAGHGHAADEKGGEAARRDQQERRAPAYPASENTGDGRSRSRCPPSCRA